MAIHQEISFDVSAKRVFSALTTGAEFAKATGAPASIDATPGGAFTCFGEQIVGRFIEISPEERIVQAWRAAAWPPGVYSIVRFRLTPHDGKTKLALDQSGHPDDAEPHLEAGWGKMYFDPLKAYFG